MIYVARWIVWPNHITYIFTIQIHISLTDKWHYDCMNFKRNSLSVFRINSLTFMSNSSHFHTKPIICMIVSNHNRLSATNMQPE